MLHGGEPLFDERKPEHNLAGNCLGFADVGLRAGDFRFNALEAFVHRAFEITNALIHPPQLNGDEAKVYIFRYISHRASLGLPRYLTNIRPIRDACKALPAAPHMQRAEVWWRGGVACKRRAQRAEK